MVDENVQLTDKQSDGYVIPLWPVNLVSVITDSGMVGCGAFDVVTLDKFDYLVARVKSIGGSSISSIDDLLAGVVNDVNALAIKRGVKTGMSGREALERI